MTGERTAPTSRRDLLLGGLFLATAGVTFARLPRRRIVAVPQPDVGTVIPNRVPGWVASPTQDAVLPSDDERLAAAVYDDQVSRSYANGVEPNVMFVLAYDRRQSGMLMVHRPESCYPGSGFKITADQPITIPLSPRVAPTGRFLSTAREERIEQVLYWTRLGDHFPSTWDEERQNLAFQNLNGVAPDGALVRLSCINPDPAAAKVALLRFARTLYGACGRDGRALLGGPATASAGMA